MLSGLGKFWSRRVLCRGTIKVTASPWKLASALLLSCTMIVCDAAPVHPQRVLMLHSFGPDFGDLYAGDLRTELDRQLPGRVDLYEEWLVSARFTSGAEDEAFARYLGALFAEHPLDLVITLGAPAANFLQSHRQTLFPSTPALFTDVEARKVLSPSRDETAIAVSVSFPAIVENILRVLPKTTTLAVVTGNSELERYWVGQIRDSLEPFRNRLNVLFLNELSFDEMLKRVATLPPGSAIFYALMSPNVPGIPEDEYTALAKLHAAANAPMFSYSDAYLGKGILGGPLLSSKEQGRLVVSAAARILDGEHASDIRMPPIEFGMPEFDSRELMRWQIRESNLPPGSVVLFREQSLWERYRWRLTSVAALIAFQTALIASLLYERRRRQTAEIKARQHLAELARMNRLSTMGALSASIAHELGQPLGAILRNSEAADLILESRSPNLKELKGILNDIRRDDQRAADVIARLRRLLTKTTTPDAHDFNINDTVQDVFALLSAEAATRKIALSTSLTHRNPRVSGDRIQIEQVILNLMMNAMDAIDSAQGQQRAVTGRTELDGGTVELSIEDSGPGIPTDDAAHLFDPLFTTKDGGMGMGLSIARTIVENHGGLIWADARTSGGAAFRFTLPLAKT
jgi:signal transduction histidine kinase